MATQMSFLEEDTTSDLKIQIKKLSTQIDNMRKGLFKRSHQEKKALDFLESEVEDLLQRYIYLFEDEYAPESISPHKNRANNKIQDPLLL